MYLVASTYDFEYCQEWAADNNKDKARKEKKINNNTKKFSL